jgi:PAS domain S-box-containing protein
MQNLKRLFQRRSIARSLILSLLLLSVVTMCVVGSLRTWFRYSDAVRRVNTSLQDIERGHLAVVSEILWLGDMSLLEGELLGILNIPYVRYVEVYEAGKVVMEKGLATIGGMSALSFPLRISDRGETRVLGRLVIHIDRRAIRSEIISNASTAFTLEAMQILLVAFLMYLITKRIVERRISALAAYVSERQAESHWIPFTFDERLPDSDGDEIERLAVAFNTTYKDLENTLVALRTSEANTRRMVETANEGVWIMNGGFVTTYVNPAMARTLGYAPEEMVGRIVTDFMYPEDASDHASRMDERGGGRPGRYERRFRCKDGAERWMLVSAVPLFDEHGKFDGSFGMFSDITRIKQNEDRLRLQTRILEILNNATGYGSAIAAVIRELRAFWTVEAVGIRLKDGDDYPYYHAEGFSEDFLKSENSLCICGAQDDALSSGNTLPVISCICGNVILGHTDSSVPPFTDRGSFWTNSLTEMHGATREPDQGEQSRNKCQAEGYESIALIPLREGDEVVGLLQLCDHRPDCFTPDSIAFLEDLGISVGVALAKERTEMRLRESEAQYRELVESANSIILRMDHEGNITFFNEFAQAFFGYDEAEILGRNAVGTIVPETDSSGRDLGGIVDDIIRHPDSYRVNENENMKRNGERVWVAWTNKPISNPDGTPREILCIGNDVTQIRSTEMALADNERLSRTLYDSMVEVFAFHEIVKDAAGKPVDYRVLEVNRMFEQVTSIKREEVLGRLATDVFGTETAPYLDVYSVVAETGEPQAFDAYFDPIRKHFRISAFCPRPGYFATVAADVTQQIELEQQVRQMQKMEAVGQLAGGVAHDFNNLLQAIQGYTDLIVQETEPTSVTRPWLDEVTQASNRAVALVRQLLTFSRRDIIKPQIINLNEIMAGLMKMLRRVIGEHYELVVVPGHGIHSICADAGQIEQVLMNLCVNARDAMPEGGRITIQTGNASFDAEYARRKPWARQGEFVRLSVSDTGIGIPEEIQGRIFEPFFTTKEVGRGTGLGLATVYGIVKQNDGLLDFRSTQGEGSSFITYFPRVDEIPSREPTDVHEPPVFGGQEILLVAEDDAQVRAFVQRMLERNGYRVITANDGEEAIRVFQRHAGEIHLCLLDMIMPNFGGREALAAIRAMKPGMPAIFTTGYDLHSELGNGVFNDIPLVRKPYDRVKLLQEIRAQLDRAANRTL